MKPLKVTPRQAEVLDLLIELGQTKLIAHRMKIDTKTVEMYIHRAMTANGYPNRLTLALAWDREMRAKALTPPGP